MTYITDRVVMITGAGSGFGRLLAIRAAADGARIVALDVSETVEETAATIRAAGGDAIHVVANVVQLDQLRAAAEAAISAFGRIDVLVNNAGVMPLAFLSDHEKAAAAWDRAIDINIKGVVHGIAAVYDQMIAQGAGHVVNISSIYGNAGVSGSAVYSATKAAVNTISDSLRIEAKGKIKVTTVRPTGVAGTKLNDSIVNLKAPIGLTGVWAKEWTDQVTRAYNGQQTAEEADVDNVQFAAITPEQLVESIFYTINQPWGVSISDITVRASGDLYVY